MNSFNLVAYLENVIKHFQEFSGQTTDNSLYRISNIMEIEGLLQNLSSTADLVLLSVDNPDGAIGSLNQTDGFNNVAMHSFYILKRAEPSNMTERDQALATCFAIAKKVVALMRQHKLAEMYNLAFLDDNRIHYKTFNALADATFFGLNITFSVFSPVEEIEFLPEELF